MSQQRQRVNRNAHPARTAEQALARVEWSNGTFGNVQRAWFYGDNTLLIEIDCRHYLDEPSYSLRLTRTGSNEFNGEWRRGKTVDSARVTLSPRSGGKYSLDGKWNEDGWVLDWSVDDLFIDHYPNDDQK